MPIPFCRATCRGPIPHQTSGSSSSQKGQEAKLETNPAPLNVGWTIPLVAHKTLNVLVLSYKAARRTLSPPRGMRSLPVSKASFVKLLKLTTGLRAVRPP
jgi:hypothetical protein